MFSCEILAQLLKVVAGNNDHDKYPTTPHAIASVPLGDEINAMLQFTDGLVVSKQKWDGAQEDKQHAMKLFMTFFTGLDFRSKLAYGFDLKKPQVRYLLMPNKDFYRPPSAAAYDPIYRDACLFLSNAVAAPPLKDKQSIQQLLENKCLRKERSATPGHEVEL